MVNAAENNRDKALILLLYETGARIGEILSLKIKHIMFSDVGAHVMLNGKTGMRRVTIVASVPALASFLDVHPARNNMDSYLFLTSMNKMVRAPGPRFLPITYAGATKIIETLARRAGLTKRVHPHLFRHSSATRAARFLTEPQLREYFGWTRGSDMPSIYVHLSQRDVDDAIRRMNGIQSAGPSAPKPLVKDCPRCRQRASPGSKYCTWCGAALDLPAALQLSSVLQQILALAPELAAMSTMSDEQLGQVKGRLLRSRRTEQAQRSGHPQASPVPARDRISP
jgi:hypothetical protein